jgi:ribosome-associated protein
MRTFKEYMILRESMEYESGDIIVPGTDIIIPRNEIEMRFDRSGGPGGQNVNKLATKATLKWSILHSPALSHHEDIRERFIQMFQNRINRDGQVVIQSQEERKQRQNLFVCITKLTNMLSQAALPPPMRVKTQPTQRSIEQHQKNKSLLGLRKKERQSNRVTDW